MSLHSTKILVLFLVLLIPMSLVPVEGQQCSTTLLYVTSISSKPTSVTVGDTIQLVIHVVAYTQDAYLGCVSHPVVGLQSATFLVNSLSTQQSNEYGNIQLTSGSVDGEYHAQIQITQDGPIGHDLAYVKANSLQFTINGKTLRGPSTNTSYQQTEDTSDFSELDVGAKPSFLSQLFTSTTDIFLVLFAIVILLLLAIVARRRRK